MNSNCCEHEYESACPCCIGECDNCKVESKQVICKFCVANNKAVHFPSDGESYCGECFHGVSIKKAIEIEGCETCELSYELDRTV